MAFRRLEMKRNNSRTISVFSCTYGRFVGAKCGGVVRSRGSNGGGDVRRETCSQQRVPEKFARRTFIDELPHTLVVQPPHFRTPVCPWAPHLRCGYIVFRRRRLYPTSELCRYREKHFSQKIPENTEVGKFCVGPLPFAPPTLNLFSCPLL